MDIQKIDGGYRLCLHTQSIHLVRDFNSQESFACAALDFLLEENAKLRAASGGLKKETVHFARFYVPHLVSYETFDVAGVTAPASVQWPDKAASVTFHKRTDIIDGERICRGEEIRKGLMYFHPDSKIESLEEVKKNPNATKILIDNMERNGCDRIIWSRWGNRPVPFNADSMAVMGSPA